MNGRRRREASGEYETQWDPAVTREKEMVHNSATSTVACTGPTQWPSIASSVGQWVGVLIARRKAVDAVGNDFGAHQPVDGKLWQIIKLDLSH